MSIEITEAEANYYRQRGKIISIGFDTVTIQTPTGTLCKLKRKPIDDLPPPVVKQKRHRRTKKEMEAANGM